MYSSIGSLYFRCNAGKSRIFARRVYTKPRGDDALKKVLSEYERKMNQEIEERLDLLEGDDYDFGKRFHGWDWVFVLVTVLAGLLIIIWGA